MNFGGKYPNNDFTFLIWGAKHQDFSDAEIKALEGKAIKVYGPITEYKGQPQIVYDGEIVTITGLE